jgi:hypothetical protein
MKTCTKCKTSKPLSDFSAQKRGKYGVRSECKACASLSRKAHYAKHCEAAKAYTRDYYAKHIATDTERKQTLRKASYAARVEAEKAKMREYYAANREKVSAGQKEWRLLNKPAIRKHSSNRRAATAKRKPKWFSELDAFVLEQAIELAVVRERLTNFKWHVDHIVPLRGKTVSGLHVWNNIAVIPAVENFRKSNNFSPMSMS